MKYNIKIEQSVVRQQPESSTTTSTATTSNPKTKETSRSSNNNNNNINNNNNNNKKSNRRVRPSISKRLLKPPVCVTPDCTKQIGDCQLRAYDCKQTCDTVMNDEMVLSTTQAATTPLIRAFANSCGPSTESFDRDIVVDHHHHNDHFRIRHVDTSSTSSNPAPSSTSSESSIDSDADDSVQFAASFTRVSQERIDERRGFLQSSEDFELIAFLGKGNEEFHLPSSMFHDASDYIIGRMVIGPGRQHNFVDFSNHSVDGWKAVLNFLGEDDPELSWQILPLVLPWFSELNSTTLLKDVDMLLLETVVVSQIDEDAGRLLSAHNLLIVTAIAYRCQLNTTKAQARQWLRDRLQMPRESSDHDSNELAFSLEDLQLLSNLLREFEELRDYLWESALIRYLPHDLNVEDSLDLVSNALFSYLLREGMVQVCIMQEAAERSSESRRRKQSDRSVSSSSTSIRGNLDRARQGRLSQDMLGVLLTSTFEGIEKFQNEKETQDPPPPEQSTPPIPKSINQQQHRGTTTRPKHKSRRSRGRTSKRDFELNGINHVEGSSPGKTRGKQYRSSPVRVVSDRKFAC